MIDLESQAQTRLTKNGPVALSRPIIITTSKNKNDEDQFKFTHTAQKVATARRLHHMRQASDHIRYEMDHPENIVKYLTGNQIFYENVTKRRIKAIVRKFPFSRNEAYKNAKDIVEIKTKKMLKVRLPRVKTNLRGETAKYTEDYPFEFDRVFDELTTNNVIYTDSIKNVVQNVIREKVKTVIAFYGTSATGKTFSILGDAGDEIHRPNPGITIQAMKDTIDECRDTNIVMSYYEIYNGRVYDLFDDKRIIPVEETKDGSVLVGITKLPLSTLDDFVDLVQRGRDCWESSLMHPNEDGRKSFLIMEITFPDKKDSGSLLFLEMASDEMPKQQELWDKEARMVMNDLKLTFNTFKECVRSMEVPKKLPPFRGCCLTLALKGYFHGNNFLLMIGHFNPVLQQEQNIFRVMTYCSKIRRPPGEVLTLQHAKTTTLEVKHNVEAAVAKEVDYDKMMKDPNELLIDNSDHNYLIELGSSPPDSRIPSLLNSARKTHRPITATSTFMTPEKGGMPLVKNSIFFPGAQLQLTMTKTKDTETKDDDAPMSALKAFEKKTPKKKKKVESIKKTVEMRASKSKQKLEGLLAMAEELQSESEFDSSPRIKVKQSSRKLETGRTQNTELVTPGMFFSKTQVPMSAEKKIDFDLEDDLELQEQIIFINKREEQSQRRFLITKDKKEHYRSSQKKFQQREKYGHYITPEVSPHKADKDLIQRKNNYYSSVAQLFNSDLSAKNEAHYRYVQDKERVHELCVKISGECDDQKIKNKGVRRELSQEICSITDSLGKIKNKLYLPEEMIEINLKEEFLREYQLQNQQLPSAKHY